MAMNGKTTPLNSLNFSTLHSSLVSVTEIMLLSPTPTWHFEKSTERTRKNNRENEKGTIERERARENESVSVCEIEREGVRARERERESVCVYTGM